VRLAQAHKLASGPYATSDTVVGEGTLTLTVGGTSTLITIDSSNHTLAGIRDAINGASDNPGITASLVTANDGVRLVLSSRDTGAASAITVTQSGTLGALVYDPGGGTTSLTQLQAAQDARVVVDGFTYDSASNTVTGMLEGVTLTLLKANVPGETTTLTVGEDRDAARKSVDEFVRAYNALVNGIRGLSAYNASTKSGGPLLGDSTLRGFNLGLRQELGIAAASAPEGFRLLAQVGITLKVDGTLEVNSSKLTAALDGGFDAVGSLFAATDGVATRLDALLERYVQSDGAIQARTDGLSASIKDITRQRDALDRRLQMVEDRLRRQFTAMDTLVAQLRNTSSFLTQQLAGLQSTGK
jgi:flagellar hook-associated protein 2